MKEVYENIRVEFFYFHKLSGNGKAEDNKKLEASRTGPRTPLAISKACRSKTNKQTTPTPHPPNEKKNKKEEEEEQHTHTHTYTRARARARTHASTHTHTHTHTHCDSRII